MTRYLHDQSKLVFLWESGTYGAVSGNGVWLGFVQDSNFTESQNVIQTRFLGQGNRNVGRFDEGPLDIEGTFRYYPQDWRMLGLALGSTSQTSVSLNFQNTMTETDGNDTMSAYISGYFNPWNSFTLEESRTGNVANKNFVRTLKGCVPNSFTMEIAQGEPVSVEVGIIAQTGSWFSGGTTSVTAGSNRPYLWSDAVLSIPGGTTMEAAKSITFSIENNFEAPHYLNGSRVIQVPYPTNRNYNVSVTQDLDAIVAGSLYNVFFQGGSVFNSTLDLNYSSAVVGSHRLTVTFSGCRMIEMEVPTALEGVSELTYSFVPGSVSAIAHDRYSYLPF